jgi:hypothetical protein
MFDVKPENVAGTTNKLLYNIWQELKSFKIPVHPTAEDTAEALNLDSLKRNELMAMVKELPSKPESWSKSTIEERRCITLGNINRIQDDDGNKLVISAGGAAHILVTGRTTGVGAEVDAAGNVQVNPAPLNSTDDAVTADFPRGGTQTLFGGAIAASVAEAAATVINMDGYNGGSLEGIINSGEGTWSLAFYTSETGTGTFSAMNIEKDDGTFVAAPAIAQPATSQSWQIKNIKAKYLKIVPTLTNASNATFLFTPSVL